MYVAYTIFAVRSSCRQTSPLHPRQSPSRSSAEPVIVGHTMTFESTVISQFGLAWQCETVTKLAK
ncbi:hypothetical protein QR685DRAFT_517908 [Neurospora intermedia]|uniref:Uncharacterized protein n=1 Tax=Neurospora intermedia TaxID=5142 RepID=A0ABR3DMD9_NEUIN